MKIIITDWEFMPGYFLDKTKWEGKECTVIRIIEEERSSNKKGNIFLKNHIFALIPKSAG